MEVIEAIIEVTYRNILLCFLGGLYKNRMTFKGYGMSQPIATNETEEGRALNRRTEFKIVGF